MSRRSRANTAARRAELETRLVMLRTHRMVLLAEPAVPGDRSAERTRSLGRVKAQIARIEAALLAGRPSSGRSPE
jgi:hypothetical protein